MEQGLELRGLFEYRLAYLTHSPIYSGYLNRLYNMDIKNLHRLYVSRGVLEA